MKLEHAAYQVADPRAVSAWYVEHLGMRIKRVQEASPFGHFLADTGDHVMLEFYRHPSLSVPDYRAIDPMMLHVAFSADDVAAARAKLIAAGATPEGDVQTTASGDRVAMLRDPWGFAVQLVNRAEPMLR